MTKNSEGLKSENSHFLRGLEQEQQLVLKCVKLIYRDTEKEYQNAKKKKWGKKIKRAQRGVSQFNSSFWLLLVTRNGSTDT